MNHYKFAYYYINCSEKEFSKGVKNFNCVYSFKHRKTQLICVIETNDLLIYDAIARKLRKHISKIEISWGKCVGNTNSFVNTDELEINKLLEGGNNNE